MVDKLLGVILKNMSLSEGPFHKTLVRFPLSLVNHLGNITVIYLNF